MVNINQRKYLFLIYLYNDDHHRIQQELVSVVVVNLTILIKINMY